MPIIDITLLEGRDLATKKRLMVEVTDLVESTLDVPRASIRVLVRELPKSHYCVGGVAKDELDG
ncbi:MAG: 4-oxalocrotonate tautomerase [Candidatus Paceibacteria bacterium]|jgi:4-oxalocrotonate tautomerase